jgi:hypothetical protein
VKIFWEKELNFKKFSPIGTAKSLKKVKNLKEREHHLKKFSPRRLWHRQTWLNFAYFLSSKKCKKKSLYLSKLIVIPSAMSFVKKTNGILGNK